MSEPVTVAARTLLAEIGEWKGLVASDSVVIDAILMVARYLLPVVEQEAAALAVASEPRFPPVVTK